jgi:hypothetical protein
LLQLGMRARLLASAVLILVSLAIPVQAQNAQALLDRYADLRAQLADNPFDRPLYVESSEKSTAQRGPFTRS